ncbi:MAG: putative phosphoesterase [Bacteroidetes bacterium]|nr:putative phosphoesterase [Bacteroidota bacterium]
MRIKHLLFCLIISEIFLASCSTTKNLSRRGAQHVNKYDFYHKDIPEAFDGFRIAFISDLHYKSALQEKGLMKLVRQLKTINPDLMLMGGDYQEGCQYVTELFDRLAEVQPKYGIAGVMGNNDYERCHENIVAEMRKHGMRVLEHTCDTISKDNQQIIVAGVRNPFDLKHNGISPTLNLKPEDFVILLTHTPDYVEDVDVTNTDLALAGHTHGGQVTLMGLYAPVVPSHYGRRFLKGKKKSSAGVPVIITNGIGTSSKKVRFFAPSEIVVIVLHCEKPELPRRKEDRK